MRLEALGEFCVGEHFSCIRRDPLYREQKVQDLRNTDFTPKSTGWTTLPSPDEAEQRKERQQNDDFTSSGNGSTSVASQTRPLSRHTSI
jgi:hypothetical protein